METFKVLIEIPKGTVNNKFEFDHKTNKMVLDFVYEDLVWPFNYGEVIGTLGGDGDALDALVYSTNPLPQSAVVDCIPFGICRTLDRGEQDDKLMLVPVGDVLTEKYKDIKDFSEQDKQVVRDLYAKIALQKKKSVIIQGFFGKERALEEIKANVI